MARLRGRDLQDQGTQRVLRFLEKNGKDREIPVRHDLEQWLLDYLAAAEVPPAADGPLFRAAIAGRPRRAEGPTALRPAAAPTCSAGSGAWPPPACRGGSAPTSFRVLVVTDLQRPVSGGPLEPQTTQPTSARDTQHRRADLRLRDLTQRAGLLLERAGLLLERAGLLLERAGLLLERAGLLLERAGLLLERAGLLLERAGNPIKFSGLPALNLFAVL